MNHPHVLRSHFKKGFRKKVQLKINDNRSTMLSVRWEQDCTKVSLHKIFLEAPKNIMQALACYVREEAPEIPSSVRSFIDTNLRQLDYSHTLDSEKIYCQGTYYNLKTIYDSLNAEYFDNKINLRITWFGKPNQKSRSRVTFGLYHDPLKLIKINRLLDSPSFPDYFIAYVIYHEMAHDASPAYYDENGVHRIHSKEFKELEMRYRYYNLAQDWIRRNQDYFFVSEQYGRS